MKKVYLFSMVTIVSLSGSSVLRAACGNSLRNIAVGGDDRGLRGLEQEANAFGGNKQELAVILQELKIYRTEQNAVLDMLHQMNFVMLASGGRLQVLTDRLALLAQGVPGAQAAQQDDGGAGVPLAFLRRNSGSDEKKENEASESSVQGDNDRDQQVGSMGINVDRVLAGDVAASWIFQREDGGASRGSNADGRVSRVSSNEGDQLRTRRVASRASGSSDGQQERVRSVGSVAREDDAQVREESPIRQADLGDMSQVRVENNNGDHAGDNGEAVRNEVLGADVNDVQGRAAEQDQAAQGSAEEPVAPAQDAAEDKDVTGDAKKSTGQRFYQGLNILKHVQNTWAAADSADVFGKE